MKNLQELKYDLQSYFVGGRTPTKNQMVEVERLRDEIAAAECKKFTSL